MNTCEDPLLSYENKLDYNLCLIIHYFDIRKPLNLPVERSKLKFCETVKLSNPKNPQKEEHSDRLTVPVRDMRKVGPEMLPHLCEKQQVWARVSQKERWEALAIY